MFTHWRLKNNDPITDFRIRLMRNKAETSTSDAELMTQGKTVIGVRVTVYDDPNNEAVIELQHVPDKKLIRATIVSGSDISFDRLLRSAGLVPVVT